MRETKFRGERIDNSEWVYGHYYYDYANNKAIIVSREEADVSIGLGSGLIDRHNVVDYETVGQFTSLKDWYKGDIIQKGTIIRAITVDYEHGLRFMLGKHQLCKQDAINGKKIGNIHDNPELLEKTQ